MSGSFDPYQEWLALSMPQRPPDHYALLGLPRFEQDAEKIVHAAMQRMAHVLQFDPGPHAEQARRIFDELETARACLGDPQRKRAYDAQLRREPVASPARGKKSWGSLASAATAAPTAHSSVPAAGSMAGCSTVSSPPQAAAVVSAESPRPVPESRRAGIVLGALALLAAVVYFVYREPPEFDPVPKLIQQLQHPDAAQRLAAARSLKQLGPRSGSALPQLVQALRSEADDEVRPVLAEVLLNAGPGTVAYAHELETIRQHESHPGVRQMLDQILAK
jgi:hypothetical protein